MIKMYCDRCGLEANIRRVWKPTPEGYHDKTCVVDLCPPCEAQGRRTWDAFMREVRA